MSRAVIAAMSVAFLLALAVAALPAAQTTEKNDFAAALVQIEAAQLELIRGRPAAFKALWSQSDDVTLVGGLGGQIEKGWKAVSARLDWVATQYSEGTRTHEAVSVQVAGDVAYVVQRETLRFRAPANGRQVTQEIRATMVFRRESGQWRLVHRHADSLTQKVGQ